MSRRVAGAIGSGLLVGLLVVLWLATSFSQRNQTTNNLYVDDIAVGNLTEKDVRSTLASSDASPRIDPIHIRIDSDEPQEFTAEQLGIGLDVGATTRAAMEHTTPRAPWSLIGSYIGKNRIDSILTIDRTVAAESLRSFNAIENAVEPTMRVDPAGELEAVAGRAGHGLDIEDTIDQLAAAIGSTGPIEIVGDDAPTSPTVSDADAEAFVTQLNERTAEGLTVVAEDFEQRFPASAIRSWLTMDATDGSINLGIDEDTALAGLAFGFGPSVPGGVDASFDIVDGVVQIVGGEPAVTCCENDAPQAVLEAVAAGRKTATLQLKVEPLEHGREWAESLQIVEPIGEFTTSYTPGQSRVTNIRRIAELTQGVVIEPGETFSVNDFVGRRTIEKGFVGAGVIYNGIYTEDVGGGISQYATTLFNAAFFGGLDFGEYQSHSLPIPRYPYGREATLSFPHPDLQIVNTTPYGVLIWPTTTNSSITVRLYSTIYATGVQSGQTVGVQGTACDRVTTFRDRTYADGRTAQDTVVAVYRPAEGFNCDGEPTDASFATTTTTTPPIFIPPTTQRPPPTTQPIFIPPTTQPPPPTTQPAPTTSQP